MFACIISIFKSKLNVHIYISYNLYIVIYGVHVTVLYRKH